MSKKAFHGSRGIAPTFLKLDSWSTGAGFIPIISTKGINQIERKIVRKKLSFMHTKRFDTCFKRWVQFYLGAIPCLPPSTVQWKQHGTGKKICPKIEFKF